MKELEYERIAMVGGEMPENLDSSDQLMFLKLRLLYDSYRKGVLNREQATKEKAKIVREYELDCAMHKLGVRWVTMIGETEKARIEYRKNRTIEAADKLIEVIEGIK